MPSRREPYPTARRRTHTSAWRLVSVGLIVAGIIGLKLAHGPG